MIDVSVISCPLDRVVVISVVILAGIDDDERDPTKGVGLDVVCILLDPGGSGVVAVVDIPPPAVVPPLVVDGVFPPSEWLEVVEVVDSVPLLGGEEFGVDVDPGGGD